MDSETGRRRYQFGVWVWLFGIALSVAAVKWVRSRRGRTPGEFKDDKGNSIKQITTDVRLHKFVRSRELSEMGLHVASGEPYLIRSGPYRELVISQPSHIQEFYQGDAKR